MGKLIPNAFNLAVVIYVALGSTACSYGMAIIGYVRESSPGDGEADHHQFDRWSA